MEIVREIVGTLVQKQSDCLVRSDILISHLSGLRQHCG